MKRLSIALLLVCVGAWFGCGRSNSTTYKSKDGEVTIEQKGDKQTFEVTTKEGKFKMATGGKGGVALPDDFPKDVPLSPGATVKMSMTSGQGLMVHLESATSAADVGKFYNEQLKGNGWNIEQTMNMGEVSTLSAKKDQRQCTVTCTKDGPKTLIQIFVMPEKS